MREFTITSNDYLKRNIQGYYHTYYLGYEEQGNPDYLNDFKNTFNDFSVQKLKNAVVKLYDAILSDLDSFDKSLTICIVPRAKAENTYKQNQLFFKKSIKALIKKLDFQDGSDYIIRHTDTKTTHLVKSGYGGDGKMPYPGIIKDTCKISSKIRDKNILLIDDIYTKGVNIDEDTIQALIDNGAKSVIFYAVAKVISEDDDFFFER